MQAIGMQHCFQCHVRVYVHLTTHDDYTITPAVILQRGTAALRLAIYEDKSNHLTNLVPGLLPIVHSMEIGLKVGGGHSFVRLWYILLNISSSNSGRK